MNKLISEFDKLIKSKKVIPKQIRLYYILKNNHYLVRNGEIKKGFSSPNISKKSDVNRDLLLSIYSKMEFIFDELIRISVLDYADNEQSERLYYILSLVPVNRKIRLFLDWKIFGPETARKFSRLFEVRNSLVHSIEPSETKYRLKTNLSLKDKSAKKRYQKDLQSGWNTLCKIYQACQNQINWRILIKEIKENNKKSS